jgi:hypothetical protein
LLRILSPNVCFRHEAGIVRESHHVFRGIDGGWLGRDENAGDSRGITIHDADKKELTEKFSTMPPHPEVAAALRKLRQEGFRLFIDSLLEVQTRQLEHGGIVDTVSAQMV